VRGGLDGHSFHGWLQRRFGGRDHDHSLDDYTRGLKAVFSDDGLFLAMNEIA